MTTHPVGFVGHRGWFWTFIASWFVPTAMTCAYIVFALTSDADAAAWGWMSIGLLFVYVLWWLFRVLTRDAAIARAIAVGDAERVLEVTARNLRNRKGPAAAPFQIYRAIGLEMRGAWAEALAALDAAQLSERTKPRLHLLAATVRIAALVETGDVAAARVVLDRDLTPRVPAIDRRMDPESYALANLATGRVLVAEGSPDAGAMLERVTGDVRAGARTRQAAETLRNRR